MPTLRSETLSAKDWWSSLKTVIYPNSKTSVPALESNGIIYTNDRNTANALNNFFQSQTILDEQNAILPEFYPSVITTELTSIVLTPFEVESVLKTLSIGKASGPNGTSNRILRELSSELSIPFYSLFNQSLRTDNVPTSYKEANVCPTPKKGDLSLVTNYRPISLLNSEAKVFERVGRKILRNRLN